VKTPHLPTAYYAPPLSGGLGWASCPSPGRHYLRCYLYAVVRCRPRGAIPYRLSPWGCAYSLATPIPASACRLPVSDSSVACDTPADRLTLPPKPCHRHASVLRGNPVVSAAPNPQSLTSAFAHTFSTLRSYSRETDSPPARCLSVPSLPFVDLSLCPLPPLRPPDLDTFVSENWLPQALLGRLGGAVANPDCLEQRSALKLPEIEPSGGGFLIRLLVLRGTVRAGRCQRPV
jgi:hypothetical protein